ncbi:MAG: hypothetical protein Q6368_008465 [Candidatus Baldrarchaeota archaeon]
MKPSPAPKPIFANNLKNVICLVLHNILTIFIEIRAIPTSMYVLHDKLIEKNEEKSSTVAKNDGIPSEHPLHNLILPKTK